MEIPRHWRLKAQRYRLRGALCPICGQPSFPPRLVCPHCLKQRPNIPDIGIPLATDPIGNAKLPSGILPQTIESTIG